MSVFIARRCDASELTWCDDSVAGYADERGIRPLSFIGRMSTTGSPFKKKPLRVVQGARDAAQGVPLNS
jgi:hypothetical protein